MSVTIQFDENECNIEPSLMALYVRASMTKVGRIKEELVKAELAVEDYNTAKYAKSIARAMSEGFM